MANIFKRLKNLHNSVDASLDACVSGSEEEMVYQETMDLIIEIEEFLYSFAWLRKQQAKDKLRIYLDSCFDYGVMCELFCITYEQAKNSVHWAATKFENNIGAHTLRLIEQGFLEEARAAFYIGTGKLKIEQMITEQCVDKLPSPQYNSFSLSECKLELKVLRLISKSTLSTYLEKVNENKMAYIMYLLQSDSKKAALFRPYLIALLTGDLREQDLIEMEENIRNGL